MANFNSNQDIDYKFENIKFENADIKMKAIFWDIIRKEQKALGEIDSKIDTIKDENLKQRLINLSGKILDTLVKLYSSGDEISILFQQLDQTLQELGKIEDENIARIIANINYEPQEQVIKQEPVQVVEEEPVIEQAPVVEPVKEEIQSTEKEETPQAVEEKKEEKPVVEASEAKEDEEEKINNAVENDLNTTEEIKTDSQIEMEEKAEEPVPAEKKEESVDEKQEVKEEPVMAIPNIEEKQKEPAEINNQDISTELPEIVSNSIEEQKTVTPEAEPSPIPEIVGIDTSTQEEPVIEPVAEETNDETESKELEPIQIPTEITPTETEQVQEPIPTIVEPVVETTDANQPKEEQQLEPQQDTKQEEQLVTTPDIQVELPENKAENIEEQSIQEEVKQETQKEEKGPDFIKTTDLPTKAILTTSKQITNLRNSREPQEALFTSINIKNRSESEQVDTDQQMSTEEMLAQVEQLYSEGRTEEAEKLMEEITANSSQLQPVNTENYTNELNQIQPTDNMLNGPITSDQKQFTLAA